jgi:hypothetical protein
MAGIIGAKHGLWQWFKAVGMKYKLFILGINP